MLYREQFNPISEYPTRVIEEWISVGTFRAKEKITAKPQQVVDWRPDPGVGPNNLYNLE